MPLLELPEQRQYMLYAHVGIGIHLTDRCASAQHLLCPNSWVREP